VVDGDYRCVDGRYTRACPIEHQQRESLLTKLASYCEGFQAIPDTIARAGDRLYEMMSGAEEPVAIIFPQSASTAWRCCTRVQLWPLFQPNRRWGITRYPPDASAPPAIAHS
jgi:hypothetical protein